MVHHAHALSIWEAFCELNRRRRAVRQFDDRPIADTDVRAVLEQALLAPSSGNLQPYELHWLRDPDLRGRVAVACKGQRAAATAPTLIVVATSRAIARRTALAQLAHVETSADLLEPSRQHHRGQIGKFLGFLRIGGLPLWSPLRALLALFDPCYSLLPLGPVGMRNWTARSGIYAAQTLLLAAAARGLDSCPMEGFDPRRVGRLLGLPRGTVIPLVVALGHRARDARIEPRWRRSLAQAAVER